MAALNVISTPENSNFTGSESVPWEVLREVNPLLEDKAADTLSRVEVSLRFLATAAQAEEGYVGAREGLGDLIDICRVTVEYARCQVLKELNHENQ